MVYLTPAADALVPASDAPGEAIPGEHPGVSAARGRILALGASQIMSPRASARQL